MTFPITGGIAVIHSDKGYKPGYIAGVVIHQGSGLTFTKGSTSLALTDFVVDPGDSILTATVGGKVGVPLLFLDGTASRSAPRAATWSSTAPWPSSPPRPPPRSTPTFGTTAFTAGLPLGTVHLVAAG